MTRVQRFSSIFGALAVTVIFVVAAAAGSLETYGGKGAGTDYTPNPEAIAALQKIDRPITIVVFHGAWCQDCQREIPRFMKILDQASNPAFTLIDYEVNPEKRDVLGKFEDYGIERVPTYIFLEGDRELGRIVEKPATTLEEDFLSIVQP